MARSRLLGLAVRIGACGLVLSVVAPPGTSRSASAEGDGVAEGAAIEVVLEPPVLPRKAVDEIRAEWIETQLATHPEGRWVPLKLEPTDAQLAKLGLPSREILLSRRYPRPTMVSPEGKFQEVELPTATYPPASYAGAGWFGIRPGAWLLLLEEDGVGWCSMAHVYGTLRSYQISTAGHCGKVGDTATVVAAFGNHNGALQPILLDFGTFARSTGDGGLGNDWALINIHADWQYLVTPTMAFWGGPVGTYTKTGDTVAVSVPKKRFVPTVTTNPDPFLVQGLVQYGHGLGVGTGGTPREGTAFSWRESHLMFEMAIAPGDSGSGINTATGDSVGSHREAAGIATHIWIDLLMRDGIGLMGGTRATKVTATLADGQLVPYPVPAPGLR